MGDRKERQTQKPKDSSKHQTLGTATCKVKPVMSVSEELKAVKVTVTPVSVFLSVCSFKVKLSFSYTVTVGAATDTALVRQCNQSSKSRLKADCRVVKCLSNLERGPAPRAGPAGLHPY